MAKDFTYTVLQQLYEALQQQGYQFLPYKEFYLLKKVDLHKVVCLRHDVDDRYLHSLHVAKMQSQMGIKGTFYFRSIPQSFNETVIKEIAALGHEIGYHYETMDTEGGNVTKAYEEFKFQLERFRQLVPITTACMHGSPLSKYDNRDLWKHYQYQDLGLIAEPYFDTDFNAIFYLTDTGRRWDGQAVSVRDKAMAERPVTNPQFLNLSFHSTFDIIERLNAGKLPNHILFTFHPQRWTNESVLWWHELIMQGIKNTVKRFIVRS